MSRKETGLGGLAALFTLVVAGAAGPPPRFVSLGPDGRLVYESSARGDRVPDFSHCGYHAGSRAIPDAPVRVVVEARPGDGGPAIQAAIDFVAGLPADSAGVRGAVLLRKGRHEVRGGLRIAVGGVVLRGQGDGPDGTSLVASGTGRRPLIRIGGQATPREEAEPASIIVDDYVPVGARRLQLDRVDGLRAGDAVLVTHPGTAAWVASLGMDRFPPGEEGFWLKWIPGTLDVRLERVVTELEGTAVTLDVPLPLAFDATLARGSVRRSSRVRPVAESGVEDLRCDSSFDPANPLDEQHAWDAIAVDSAEDCWVRQVTCRHFAGSAVRIGDDARRITVIDCASGAPTSEVAGYRRHTFFTSGQQSLFLRCRAEDGRHDFAVGALAAGPNAFVECQAARALGFSGPIESWATGVLYDNVNIDGAGLALTNRESDGQGAGWAAANCVLWQCTASVVTCRNPPGARNWAIGCWGQFLGDGLWQMPNEFVEPEGLYKAQLAERLGPEAVARLERRPIRSEAGNGVAAAADLPPPVRHEPPKLKPLTLQGGWLTRGGSLLCGARVGTVWWRGNLLPARAPTFGPGVTRFVPGRDGPGYTDDLDALTDAMARSGRVALEHHWGLWYDRRRDDHEMVRRPDGDAWPPFYEQPWARSGRGKAWDGLSRYDLTAFNPWYFGRLDEFAELCDRKGLVLLHEAYFQHNLLEAGAHWADFPWRPANCLQEAGFPEPPPYLNKKRIALADVFYDVAHPVRRDLHRLYIRRCLDALGAHSNVIYLTGEEYTGPLEFMRFWIDTIMEWKREASREVLIGLSSTRDVQDAILADPARRDAVSVIDLKYWWYAADGRPYDPEGGRNLAPRQQLRAWKGAKGRSDEQTARQVREYRNRYPGKAVLCADPKANPWVILAAGASMPALPRATDPRLLAAVPRMRPTGDGGQSTLADPGRDYLTVAPAGGPIRVDLSAADAPFSARRIDPRTGRIDGSSLAVAGGRIVEIPVPDSDSDSDSHSGPIVLWLTRDETSESAKDAPR
jgi:hypothetical protein